MTASACFVLLIPDGTSAGALRAVRVPKGVSYVRMGRRLRVTKKAPKAGMACGALEPVRSGRRDRLLLLAAPGGRVRRNGAPAPQVVLLAEGDQVQWPDSRGICHVSRLSGRQVETVSADLVGSICPVCLTPFRDGTTVLRCAFCGQPLHLEAEDKGDERLDCARVCSACPTCQREVLLPSPTGLTYVPAGMEASL